MLQETEGNCAQSNPTHEQSLKAGHQVALAVCYAGGKCAAIGSSSIWSYGRALAPDHLIDGLPLARHDSWADLQPGVAGDLLQLEGQPGAADAGL